LKAWQIMNTPWALQMTAVSHEEPARLMRTLTGAILGLGGWVLRRDCNDAGKVNMLFEFERRACIDIYTALVATGVELGASEHIQLTDLCRCTQSRTHACGNEIASIELEIMTSGLPVGPNLTSPVV
jgi:hypothetical protein